MTLSLAPPNSLALNNNDGNDEDCCAQSMQIFKKEKSVVQSLQRGAASKTLFPKPSHLSPEMLEMYLPIVVYCFMFYFFLCLPF